MNQGMLRRLADIVRVSLILGAVVFAALGREAAAWSMALVAATTLVLRVARAPGRFDLLAAGLLALDAWATSLGMFEHFNRNDVLGHVLLPAAVTPVLHRLAARAGVVPRADVSTLRRATATACSAAILTITLGTAWELVERASDLILGTHMSLGYVDTLGDLLADCSGALAGAVLLVSVLRRDRRSATGRDQGARSSSRS